MASVGFLIKLRVIARQFKEGMTFTFNELRSNKFRTFLSLLSVSIGIFTIVAILTAVDTLEKQVRQSFESLNTNQVNISKWPMVPEDDDGNQLSIEAFGASEYKWWDYARRPNITYDDYKFLKDNLSMAEVVTFSVSYYQVVAKNGRKSISNTTSTLVTEGYDKTLVSKIAYGRGFALSEIAGGAYVVIIGNEIAESLFDTPESAIGSTISLNGYKVNVIGVLEKEGGGMVSFGNNDQSILIPYSLGKIIFSLREPDGEINAVAKEGYSNEELKDEIKQVLKNFRRIRPGEKLNFSVNQFNFLEEILDKLVSTLSGVGWIIAIFSLLIGGFGIANIMFVSVKERTKIIGIQKALGAKKYFIMVQFLTEAIVLAISGAVVGLLIVLLLISVLPIPENINVSLSFSNIVVAIGVASLIGVLSGAIPAYTAANLNPVDAINSK